MDAGCWPHPGAMNPVRLTGPKSSVRERRVFRRRRPRPLPSVWRQGLEGVLMVLLGVGLLAFLAWLPQQVDGMVLVSEMISDLISGLVKLLTALLGLASVLLIAAVLLTGLVSLLGGGTRLMRALVRLLKTPRRPKPQCRRVPPSRRPSSLQRR